MAKAATVRKSPVLEPEVLPEAAVTRAEGTTIVSWLATLGPFFARAGELEQASRVALDGSRLVPAPTTGAEDEAIQVLIKANAAARKGIEEHWTITAKLSAFHKRLTSARGRATTNYDSANERLQRLHNDYVDDQRRKAAMEQERVRRENEARAAEERARELEALEAEAVKAEEASTDLSEREALFVDYLTGPYRDPNRAAQQAGFKDPFKASVRLMASPKIQAAVTAKQTAQRIREQAAAVKETPLTVRTETVRPDVQRAAGASDRTYHHADILDAKAFVTAALAGTYGIPAEALLPNQVWLSEQAKAIQAQIERYPGIRYRKTTKTV